MIIFNLIAQLIGYWIMIGIVSTLIGLIWDKFYFKQSQRTGSSIMLFSFGMGLITAFVLIKHLFFEFKRKMK